MNPEIKDQWVKALRSGDYTQGKEVLRDTYSDTYCCLGVLCEIAIKSGVDVKYEVSRVGRASYNGERYDLPTAVMVWAGLENISPAVTYNERGITLAELNDQGMSFDKISYLIEDNL